MPQRTRFIVIPILIAILCLSGLALSTQAPRSNPVATSLILVIGDGMGLVQRQAASYYAGRPLAMDQMPVYGMMTTHSLSSLITDSGAAATAMATGVKTINGMISTDIDGRELKTIAQAAKEAGKRVGLVVTSEVTDATPAAFATHAITRTDQTYIASDLIASRIDLILGGGLAYFRPISVGGLRTDARDLVREAVASGYTYVDSVSGLNNLNSLPALGLFARECMAYEIDRDPASEPSLECMTRKALDLLSKSTKGFFLMVEASQIDGACHDNDAAAAITDVLAADAAVKVCIDFVSKNPGTVLIVTGDHETGGMSLGNVSGYRLDLSTLSKVKSSARSMAAKVLPDRSNVVQVLKGHAGLDDLMDDEVEEIKASRRLVVAMARAISSRAHIGWTTTSHTAAPVPVTAMGPGSEIFGGMYDNTDLAMKMASLLGLRIRQHPLGR